MMTEQEKIQLYRDRFPESIENRMIDQFRFDHVSEDGNTFQIEVSESASKAHLIMAFSDWTITNEGGAFWLDVHTLYSGDEEPDEKALLKIFKKHKIA